MIDDGLEMQLLILRDMEETAQYAQIEAPMACATCYQLEALCVCSIRPLLWPVGDVAIRLEQTIKRRRNANN